MAENDAHFLDRQIKLNAAEKFSNLPVFEHLGKITETLKKSETRTLVLTAETGAGKSTAVPFALANSFDGKVLLLEPRRLAVLSLAKYASEIVEEPLGQFAGYRMHLDSMVSKTTKLEVVTEAVALRLIQSDPALEGFSVIIIDEFHERSVYADTFLAFLKETMQLRGDLFLVVMSATIDAKKLCAFLDCPHYSVPGRLFPVEIEYAPTKPENAVIRELDRSGGSILVFLPGIRDIRRAEENLKNLLEARQNIEICILHSSISLEEQRHVLSPPEKGVRRIILSSSIAETSLTLPDITSVIDSGLARISRFDARTGMNRLVTENESEFSAAQRAGRAGRTQKGRCVRLWDKNDLRQQNLAVEILRSDIMSVILECACWGALSRTSLDWLDLPPQGAWCQAVEFLEKAELLEHGSGDPDKIGSITALGKFVLSLGIHPRLAIVAASSAWNGDVQNALGYVAKYSGESSPERAKKLCANIANKLKTFKPEKQAHVKLKNADILLEGFFDRVAKYEGNRIYQLYSGRKAKLCADFQTNMADSALPEYIIAVNADAGGDCGTIYEAEPLSDISAWLEAHSKEDVQVFFEDTKSGRKVRKVRSLLYGKICLKQEQLKTEKDDIARAYLSYFRQNGIKSLPWNKVSANFFERARFFAAHSENAEAADGTDEAKLLETLEDWLLPFWGNSAELSEEAFLEALRYKFDGRAVDKAVPLRFKLENGKEVSVKYEELDKNEGPVPVIEIIIQQIFGCKKTPKVCGVPVLLRLLSPARRPLQVTRDLEGFWKNTWPEICKEMKGRYPKHNWDAERPE
ncbi:MAG: DEAD/DEAH box helicase [Spirochaetaceae bacterium]|nr:DEAD/DEAH box helicase [Spirochaetaceae bacterium]